MNKSYQPWTLDQAFLLAPSLRDWLEFYGAPAPPTVGGHDAGIGVGGQAGDEVAAVSVNTVRELVASRRNGVLVVGELPGFLRCVRVAHVVIAFSRPARAAGRTWTEIDAGRQAGRRAPRYDRQGVTVLLHRFLSAGPLRGLACGTPLCRLRPRQPPDCRAT